MDQNIDLSAFFGELNGKTRTRQMLTREQINATAEEANTKLRNFLIDCKTKIPDLADAFVGPIKDDKVLENKAIRDYGGDASFVCDKVRGKGVVTNAQQVLSMQQILDDPHNEILKKHGMFVVHKTDFFSDPKEPTGYRALNYRLAVPVVGGYQIVELQVVAEQIEAVYDLTHPHKRAIEKIYDGAIEEIPEYDNNGQRLTTENGTPLFTYLPRELNKVERLDVSYHTAKLALINGQAAKEYHCLIRPDLAGKYEMTPVRQRKLEQRVEAYEAMEYL
jgi:hypothetical protein